MTAVDTGPVTLAEAKTLALAKRPKLAAQAMSKGAVPPASPANVGAERENLEKERREEYARRIREYTATMEIMKKRGARRPRPKRATEALEEPASFVPLQIFAEGDSWFDYPIPFFGGGIVPRLERLLGVPILNLAKAGDEARYMLGVEERTLLAQHLSQGCPAGGPWDVLLFSGGGNDIVDNPMALWVRDWNPALPPADHIHQPRFDTAKALVRAAYEDLIALRDTLSPGTHLVFHGYDFAIPSGRGVCGYGPWLKPTFDLRRFPPGTPRQEVVNAMLRQFAALLTSLATVAKVTFINGQGTLPANAWHNELHPSKAGFEKFAGIFYRELKKLYPNRVA
ncbi:SGNH/GDSL hydrolase family protein [Methyloceanibacter sp.]|uniref:SGNH/GDSL hydrolase family protein n=1 Tax=Methyloceanibacter sp. TaxID=1965321 RepID=UPI002D2DC9E8|nr:SGNH/GDSL hydrolase family protein [Methyloceanibacter sp.]HZP09711.1 SGNH/GDSL hydrolase family protein [Methyloceanibacter sp.]